MTKSKLIAAIATAAALVASVPAYAADDWGGSYVGVQLGFGDTGEGSKKRYPTFGVQAGHDWQIDNWVVGLGVDSYHGEIGTGFGNLDSLSRVKVRGGYAFGDTLAYVSAGASYGMSRDFGNDWGYSAGIGVEHRISERVSLTGEISQHRFDDFNKLGSLDATTVSVGVNYRF
ncbi:putative outer membrane protein [Aliiruegeria haliotis]|uniref:Putative outer membrane protein n=1 Tax=Aliiruegeria haliotis TaxID=1280846 RepID=A0A2T0RPR6_9RHOB|nr:porin family protein [Aliiruegeria haliotis]PRY23185.1 putative outer membrane protein [Aliiruegeria haliotis]